MVEYLEGRLESKGIDFAVLDISGIGYKVGIPLSTSEKLPAKGGNVRLYIVESVGMYGGTINFYGFLSHEERDLFLLLKQEVPGAGAKKALDYLDKVTKSLPDFKRVIINKDVNSLIGIFGFSKKTSEKLIAALKDKIAQLTTAGKEKWAGTPQSPFHSEAVQGLIVLGYSQMDAAQAVGRVLEQNKDLKKAGEIIRRALRYL
jgi:holliday junction DNA helicase RuvA